MPIDVGSGILRIARAIEVIGYLAVLAAIAGVVIERVAIDQALVAFGASTVFMLICKGIAWIIRGFVKNG